MTSQLIRATAALAFEMLPLPIDMFFLVILLSLSVIRSDALCKYAQVAYNGQFYNNSLRWVEIERSTLFYDFRSSTPNESLQIVQYYNSTDDWYVLPENESLLLPAENSTQFIPCETCVTDAFLVKRWINETFYRFDFSFFCDNFPRPTEFESGRCYDLCVSELDLQNYTFCCEVDPRGAGDADPALQGLSNIPIDHHNVHTILNESLKYSAMGEQLNADDVTCLAR